jgi:hypothetical protein
MIRQAINCDMCGAEKQTVTSHWFVAYEQDGELKLRGWESPKTSRKNVKHLCGQKCVQRLTANFTAAVMAAGHGSETEKETTVETVEQRAREAYDDREDMPILERMGYDRATAARIEEESWAGPAKPKESWAPPRPKENSWEHENKLKTEREGLLDAARAKSQTPKRFPAMA